jgi:hypothetical protein
MPYIRAVDDSHQRSALKIGGERPAQANENSMAMELNASEIRSDLVKILTYLKTNLAYQQGANTFLMTDVQALLYAERVASYALYDYPRQFEDDTHITFLWDTLNHIARTVTAWRTAKSGGDGQMELVIIKKNIDLALAESERLIGHLAD